MNNKETLTIEKKKKKNFQSLKIIDNLNNNKKKVVHTNIRIKMFTLILFSKIVHT